MLAAEVLEDPPELPPLEAEDSDELPLDFAALPLSLEALLSPELLPDPPLSPDEPLAELFEDP